MMSRENGLLKKKKLTLQFEGCSE